MKSFFLYVFLLASFFGMGQAITFGRLGGGLENKGYYTPIRSMFFDTIDRKLYVSGQFKTAENKVVWGAAVWNGTMWDSLRGGLAQYPQSIAPPGTTSDFAWKIIRYKNKIYFGGGGIEWVNGKNQYDLGVWNGADWDYPLPEPSPANNSINDMVVYNDTLYACGNFTNFGSVTCNYVAKYDGTGWYPVGDLSKYYKGVLPPAQVNAIEVFNNEIYIGGAWDDSTGTTRNIAKYNGTEWVNVGTGIQQSGVNAVWALREFNNKLYVGGLFGRTQQIPGAGLVVWNGINYEQVNPFDITSGGTINKLVKHKDKLVILGSFLNYGPFPIVNIFYIDSSNLGCIMPGLQSTFNNTTTTGFFDCAFMSDSLVVGGLFQYLDTVAASNVGVITNYDANSECLITGLKQNNIESEILKIYPNPTHEQLIIEFKNEPNEKIYLGIQNLLGQTFCTQGPLKQYEEVDLKSLSPGVYFLKVCNNTSRQIFKIIKE